MAAPIAISPPDSPQPLAAAERAIAVEPKALINDLLNGFADLTYPTDRGVKHVRLNVKKVNPLAGQLDDGQVGTTTKGQKDQTDSGTSDTGQPVAEAPDDSDPAGASDGNAGGEQQDSHTDADQGAE